MAARGTEETSALLRLRLLLLDSALWGLMPEEDLTTLVSSIAMRMISSAGALIEQLQAGPHARPPFKVFLLLDGMGPDDITNMRQCLLDQWSKQFLDETRT